jgi:chemotaxis protein MotA
MERLTLFGFILAIVALLGGQMLEGGSLSALVNLPALIIVLLGTIAAVMIQTPSNTLKRALVSFKWMFVTPSFQFSDGKQQIVKWASIARKDGLLGLENIIDKQTDPFIRKSLEYVVDGLEPHVIRSNLLAEVDMLEYESIQASRVYEAMGGYSPTMGIIGAVLGLIHVMGNLQNPELLGPGVATAFVATIYGVAFANFVFIPVSNKLKSIVMRQSQFFIMYIEGVIAIADGDNPKVIAKRLDAYIHLNK